MRKLLIFFMLVYCTQLWAQRADITNDLEQCTTTGIPVQFGGVAVPGAVIFTNASGEQIYCRDTIVVDGIYLVRIATDITDITDTLYVDSVNVTSLADNLGDHIATEIIKAETFGIQFINSSQSIVGVSGGVDFDIEIADIYSFNINSIQFGRIDDSGVSAHANNSGVGLLAGVTPSITTPVISFRDDPTTGISHADAVDGIYAFISSGTEIARVNPTSFGIGTTGADRILDVLDASNPQLRLSHTDGTIWTDFQTDATGDLTISLSGSEVHFLGDISMNANDIFGINSLSFDITGQNIIGTATELTFDIPAGDDYVFLIDNLPSFVLVDGGNVELFGNDQLFGATIAGDGVLRIGDVTTAPSGTMTSGGLLYVSGTSLNFMDDAGTITDLTIGGGGETNTHSSDGGGIVLTAIVPKVGVDLRLVSLDATGGSGIVISSGSDLVTVDIDINSLVTATIAAGDFVPFWDITATATNKKTTFANFEAAIDHGNILGLTDDDHNIYALLAGRAGGQVLIGGTGTTDDLTLQTTAGVGAAGADMHFLVGNNGDVEAMTILNNGDVGIGASPAADLDVNQTKVGGTTSVRSFNADNTNTSSNAEIAVVVGGESGGDPFSKYEISGTSIWTVGLDNSDGNRFKIGNQTTPSGGSETISLTTSSVDFHQDMIMFVPSNDANPQIRLGSSTTEEVRFSAIFDGGAQTLNYVEFDTDAVSATVDKGAYKFIVDGIEILDIDDDGVHFAAVEQGVAFFTVGQSIIANATAMTFDIPTGDDFVFEINNNAIIVGEASGNVELFGNDQLFGASTAGVDVLRLGDVTTIPVGTMTSGGLLYVTGTTIHFLADDGTDTDLTAAVGEVNTHSSLGGGSFALTAAVPKTGVNLNLISVSNGDGMNASLGSDVLTLAVASTVVQTDQTNTFGDFAQIFADDQLFIQNPASTFEYQIIGAAIAADRTVTLPLLTGNDVFVTEAFAQTLTNKTIDADLNTITDINDDEIASHTSTKITITTKGQLNSNIVYTDQTNTFGDFDQIFPDNRLFIQNPAASFEYQLIGAAIAADRTVTFPLLTGNDVFVTEAFTQTLTNKTLSTGNTVSAALTWSDGVRQIFNPDGTNSGVNVGANGAEPSAPVDGDIFYDSGATQMKGRINGAWVNLGAAGGGNVSNTGTPVNNQLAVWTDATTIEGTVDLTFNGTDFIIYRAVNDANPEIRLGSADAEEFHLQTVYATGTQLLDFVLFQTDEASATVDRGLFRFNVDAADILDIDDSGIDFAAVNMGVTFATAGQSIIADGAAMFFDVPTNDFYQFEVNNVVHAMITNSGVSAGPITGAGRIGSSGSQTVPTLFFVGDTNTGLGHSSSNDNEFTMVSNSKVAMFIDEAAIATNVELFGSAALYGASTSGDGVLRFNDVSTVPVGTMTSGGLLYVSGVSIHFLADDGTDTDLTTGGGGEINTHSSDGGGLALTAATPKVGVDLRLVSVNAAGGSGVVASLGSDLLTIDMDINSLTVATVAAGDFVPFWDITATATNKKTTFANFEAVIDHANIVGAGGNIHIDWTAASAAFSTTSTGAFGGDLTIYEATNDANPQIRIGAVDAEEFHLQTVYATGTQLLDFVLFQTDEASATADRGLYRFNVDGTDILDIDDSGIDFAAVSQGITFATAGQSIIADATAMFFDLPTGDDFVFEINNVAVLVAEAGGNIELFGNDQLFGASTAGVDVLRLGDVTTVPVGTMTSGGLLYVTGTTIHFLADDGTDTDLTVGGGETNTHSSDGGGLVLTAATPKVGVDLRLVSLSATGGSGIVISSGSDLITVDLDLNDLATETVMAAGDFIGMVDITETNASNKITFANFEAAIDHANIIGSGGNIHIDWTAASAAFSTTSTGAFGGDLTIYEAVNDGNPEIRLGAVDAEEAHIQAVYDGGAQTLNYLLFQTDAASATVDKGLFKFNVDGTEILDIDDGGIHFAVASQGVTFGTAGQSIIADATAMTFDIPTGDDFVFEVNNVAVAVFEQTGNVELFGNDGLFGGTTPGVDVLRLGDVTTVPVGTMTSGGLLYVTGTTIHFLADDGTDTDLTTGGGGEINTHSSDGGGLALTAATPKVGVDLRLVSLSASGGDGIVISSGSDLITVDLDINDLVTETTIAAGDFVPFWDITVTASNQKMTFANFEAAIDHANIIGAGGNIHIDWTAASAAFSTTSTGAFGGDLTIYEAANDANPQIRIGAVDAEEFHLQTVYATGTQLLDFVLFQTDEASATADRGLYRFNVDGTDILDIDDSGIDFAAVDMGVTFATAGQSVIANATAMTFDIPTGDDFVFEINNAAILVAEAGGNVELFGNDQLFGASTAGVDVLRLGDVTTAPVGTMTSGGLLYVTGTTIHFLADDGTDTDLTAGGGGDLVDDTTPQLGGGLDLNDNNITIELDGGQTIPIRALCVLRIDLTDGEIYLANANDANRSTSMMVMAQEAGSDGSTTTFITYGPVSGFTGLTTGDVYYMSNSVGGIQNTAPTGSAHHVRVIGYALSATVLFFDPSKTWVLLPV